MCNYVSIRTKTFSIETVMQPRACRGLDSEPVFQGTHFGFQREKAHTVESAHVLCVCVCVCHRKTFKSQVSPTI